MESKEMMPKEITKKELQQLCRLTYMLLEGLENNEKELKLVDEIVEKLNK